MEKLSIEVSEHPFNKAVTLMALKGFIDATTAPNFERKFMTLLGEKKFKLVVDLKDVHYIGSLGWGIFISEIKRIREQKGDLVLAGMIPEVSEVFKLLELNKILKSFSDCETAVQNGFRVNRMLNTTPKV